MQVRTAVEMDMRKIKKLYRKAFPPIERRPFYMLKQQDKLLVLDDGEFSGFFSLASCDDIIYVEYYAVSKERRGMRYGSKGLEELKKRYPDRRIFLEIERLDAGARNALQRKRRKAFYLRNGFENSGIFVNVKGCDYEILCLNGKITYEEYQKVVEFSMGKRLYKKANVREVKEINGRVSRKNA